ncbi:hypothetical protein [Halocola ammonii]
MQLSVKPNHELETVLIFGKEGKDFRLDDLAEFLRHLKGVYGYLLNKPELFQDFLLYDTAKEDQRLSQLSQQLPILLEKEGLSKNSITRYYNKDLGDSELFISQIRKQSPLMITISVASLALVGAVILSGGKLNISLSGIKVELNAIGDGLKKFHEFVQISNHNRKGREEAALIVKDEHQKLSETPEDTLRESIKRLKKALATRDLLDTTRNALEEEIVKKEKELARRR